jgi:hypothetical protein
MKDFNLIFTLNWFDIKLKRFSMQVNKKKCCEMWNLTWDQTEEQTSSVERTFSSQNFFANN